MMFQLKILIVWIIMTTIYAFMVDEETEEIRNKIKERINIGGFTDEVDEVVHNVVNYFKYGFYDTETFRLIKDFDEFWK